MNFNKKHNFYTICMTVPLMNVSHMLEETFQSRFGAYYLIWLEKNFKQKRLAFPLLYRGFYIFTYLEF